MPFTLVAHGGASSLSSDADGPRAACKRGLAILEEGGTVLDAAVAACAHLEDDPRFNAGTGSNLRLDGTTIEMDASCMTGDGRYGAVACIRDVRNPVRVARDVLAAGLAPLAGDGAIAFARRGGHGPYDPLTTLAQRKFEAAHKAIRLVRAQAKDQTWSHLESHWNYEMSLQDALAEKGTVGALAEKDTVGAIASDGESYAGALSTGGTISTLLGRVGDVPMPGCGLFVWDGGGVAVTGDGDFLARRMLAYEVAQYLEAGEAPKQAIQHGIMSFPSLVDVGIILVHQGQAASGSNREMAAASLEG